MATRRITIPKPRRDVAIRSRFDVKRARPHFVRWIEDVDGIPTRTEVGFATREEAEAKARLCRLMMGIIHAAETTIGKKLLRAGELSPLIDVFIGEATDRRLKARMNEEGLTADEARDQISAVTAEWLLRSVPMTFDWKMTTDIPPDALDVIKTKLADRGTFVVKHTQKLVRAFVRRFRREYAFYDEILDGPLCKHVPEEYYIWLDQEKDLIFRELTAPLRVPDERANWSAARRRGARRHAEADLAKRRALFLVIWPQMLWGLRPREAIKLRVRDWNPATNELTLRITKNKKVRSFVVDLVTATMLTRLTRGRDPHDFIYYTARGKPWKSYHLMSRQFKEVLDRLGLRGSLYSCRHYAATTLAELMPRNWPSVMAITGHGSMEVLQRYVLKKGGRVSPAAGEYNQMYQDIVKRLAVSVIDPAQAQSAADAVRAAPVAPPAAVVAGDDPDVQTIFTVEDPNDPDPL